MNINNQLISYYKINLIKHLYHNIYYEKKYINDHKYSFFFSSYTSLLNIHFFTQKFIKNINQTIIKKKDIKNIYYKIYKFKLFYLTHIIFNQNSDIHIYYISNPSENYNSDYFLDGFLLLICDIKNKKGTIIDMRLKKEFFITNNKKLEKKELYFYKIFINICFKYKIHKIILNDYNNFYYNNKIYDMFTYYYPIYKKSWYEHKLYFTFIKSNSLKKIKNLYNLNDYLLLKKRLKKYKIKNFNDSCNIVKKLIFKKYAYHLYSCHNNYFLLNLFSKKFLHNYFIKLNNIDNHKYNLFNKT